MKIKIRHTATVILCFLILGSCTKINVINIPPPDFKQLILAAGAFKMYKVNSSDALLSRPTSITAKASSGTDEVIFVETFLSAGVSKTFEYKVRFVSPAKNAVYLNIAEQTVDGKQFKGIPLDSETKDHGFYLVESSSGASINELYFSVQYDGVKYSYAMER